MLRPEHIIASEFLRVEAPASLPANPVYGMWVDYYGFNFRPKVAELN
jgi:hypothetical protein